MNALKSVFCLLVGLLASIAAITLVALVLVGCGLPKETANTIVMLVAFPLGACIGYPMGTLAAIWEEAGERQK